MKTLEKKSEPMLDCPMSSTSPTFYVCDEQMPEIADWETGEEHTIKIKIRMQRKNVMSNLDSENIDATMEMLSYEVEK